MCATTATRAASRRFFVYLNLFIAAMMILVSGDNYLMLFVGWEGVGLCSYLLIGFWFEKGKDGIGNALAGQEGLHRQPHRRFRLPDRHVPDLLDLRLACSSTTVFAAGAEAARSSRRA